MKKQTEKQLKEQIKILNLQIARQEARYVSSREANEFQEKKIRELTDDLRKSQAELSAHKDFCLKAIQAAASGASGNSTNKF